MHVPELVRIGALVGISMKSKSQIKLSSQISVSCESVLPLLQKKKAGASTAKTIQSNFQIKSANQT